jgi:organic anion transporter 4A
MDSSNIQTTFFSKRWIAYALVIFSTVLNGIVATGFVNTSFGTLERRFGFSSTTLGVISGVAYLGTLAFTLPFSLMAQEKGAPKLRLIAIGLFFIGLGSVFYSLPHFIAGPVERLSHPTEENLCQSNQQSASLQVSFPYEAFFIVGNLFLGIGSAPFFPVGYTYLREFSC